MVKKYFSNYTKEFRLVNSLQFIKLAILEIIKEKLTKCH